MRKHFRTSRQVLYIKKAFTISVIIHGKCVA